MTEWQATFVMVGLFALRCIVPLLVTIGLGYLMNRLVDRWEAEEEAIPQQPPQRQPLRTREPAIVTAILSVPCWIMNDCPRERRENCPAFQARGVPCWRARERAQGALPADCPDCPRYIAGQAST